jgi:hypothetical protein
MKVTRLHIAFFLGVSALIWGCLLFIGGQRISLEMLAPFGSVVGALSIVFIALEHWLWKWSWLHGWFITVPDLRGTWIVTLQSSGVDPVTNQPVPAITCYMGVEQTLSTLNMHLMTPESESYFIAHSIYPSRSSNGYEIAGVYVNRPSIHLRGNRSNMHLGALMIDTHGPAKGKPTALSGEYWTDRKTVGTMNFTKRVDEVCTSYTDAALLLAT